MGNNTTKESRAPESTCPTSNRLAESGTSGPASPTDRHPVNLDTARTGRGSRPDLSMFGIGSSSNNEVPERRETKQEREARKLGKERAARLKERERSIKEEHVDGGYLVTMGVYTGTEDFNKAVVRQLMVCINELVFVSVAGTNTGRLSDESHLSGEVSMIIEKIGQNINWLQLAEAFLFLQLMKSPRKISSGPHLQNLPVPPTTICRILWYLSLQGPIPPHPMPLQRYRHHTLPSPFLPQLLKLLPLQHNHHHHFGLDQRPSRLSQHPPKSLHRLKWYRARYNFLKILS
jgi:hypothetical protein